MAKNKKPQRPAKHLAKQRTRKQSAAASTATRAPRTTWQQRLRDSLFSTAESPVGVRWEYFWHVLLAAFVARAGVALSGEFVLHPDEIMQYLEPAHYAAFGNGVLFWEYLGGARSWLIPGTIAVLLKSLDAIGLGQPSVYIPVVKLFFCLVSLLLPWAMYRFTRITVGEQAGRLALLFGCFWYELVAMAHKPFTEFVGTAIFMTALALCVGRRAEQRGNLFAIGLLAALVGAVRLQYAPIALALLLLRSANLCRNQMMSLWAGALATTVMVGIFEWQTWGAPFHSYLLNFVVNLNLNFGGNIESSPWALIGQLIAASGGGALLAFIVGARMGKRHLLILSIGVATLLLHLPQKHHEYRFLYLMIPCWLMLLAAWIAQLDSSTIATRLRRYLPIAMLVFGVPALLNVFPWQSWVYENYLEEREFYYLRNQDPTFEVMSFLAKQDDVRGVIARNVYVKIGGYYYLHHAVPFYSVHSLRDVLEQRPGTPLKSLASHIITDTSDPLLIAREDFEPLLHHGDITLWRRINNDQEVLRWRELVVKKWHPRNLVLRVVKQLRANPVLRFFIADLPWAQSAEKPRHVQLLDE